MKPLVFWCRWHEARLRLAGRDDAAVWGELVYATGSKPFRYELKSQRLTVGTGPAATVTRLDEMGIALAE